MAKAPKVDGSGQQVLDQAQENFDSFKEQVEAFNPLGAPNIAPESEPQTKLSKREINKVEAEYIKPLRSQNRPVNDKMKVYFDEKNRAQRDRDWEYVKCIVENNEVVGESVETWTGKWGCDPAHFWRVPVNKPVMIPRHLAEQLSKCSYHRLKMEDSAEKHNYVDKGLIVDQVVRRIDARPVGFGF